MRSMFWWSVTDPPMQSEIVAGISDPGKRARVEALCIDLDASLVDAFRQMDALDRKLLIVVHDQRYVSLLSAGDIQRKLIAGGSLTNTVRESLRRNVRVASSDADIEEIRGIMQRTRAELMPVVDDSGALCDVVFWDDLFAERHRVHTAKVTIPAVIMAGGRGARLRPLTNVIPKPLVPMGEKPIIEIIMDSFHQSGVNEFHVSVNYKAEMIRQYFSELTKPYSIRYVTEPKPLGTAGSLSLLAEHIETPFFVSNCDILIDQEYQDVYYYHRDNRCDLTVVAAIRSYPIPYGTVETGADGMLTTLKEKPTLSVLANTGVYLLEPHLLREIPPDTFLHITDLIERVNSRGGRVGVFPISERAWLDIGEWAEYQKSQELFSHRATWATGQSATAEPGREST